MKRIVIAVLAVCALALPAQADLIAGKTTVATTATVIVTAPGRGATYRFQNVSAASVFLGASAVTTATGYELKANGITDVTLKAGEKAYGIVAAATSDVHWYLIPRLP